MSKGVLGNDPFVRGAAPRDAAAPTPKPQDEPEAQGQAGRRSKRPRSTKSAPSTRARSSERAVQSLQPEEAVEAVQPEEAVEAVQAEERVEPAETVEPAQAEAPLPGGDALAHEASPELVADMTASGIAGHADSPTLVAIVNDVAIPHERSPELVANVGADGMTGHQDSPTLVEVRPTDAALSRPPSAPLVEVERAGRAPRALARFFQSPTVRQATRVASGLLDAVSAGAGFRTSLELDEYGRDAALVRSLEPISDFLIERFWRISVFGADQLPAGPAILVANHSGAIPVDGPVLRQVLLRERPDLREARWLAEDQVFHAPFLGTLMNRLGAVRACPENAERLLEEGRPLIVFPEGVLGIGKPFHERYTLKRFGRGGFVKLALRLEVPLHPVAIVGAEESMPLLARLPGKLFGLPYLPLTNPIPLPTRWHIRFGPPLDLSPSTPNEGELARVQRLTELTRSTIGQMLSTTLASRSSIF